MTAAAADLAPWQPRRKPTVWLDAATGHGVDSAGVRVRAQLPGRRTRPQRKDLSVLNRQRRGLRRTGCCPCDEREEDRDESASSQHPHYGKAFWIAAATMGAITLYPCALGCSPSPEYASVNQPLSSATELK